MLHIAAPMPVQSRLSLQPQMLVPRQSCPSLLVAHSVSSTHSTQVFIPTKQAGVGALQPLLLMQSTHVAVATTHCSPTAQPPVASQFMQVLVAVLHWSLVPLQPPSSTQSTQSLVVRLH